MNIPGTQPEEHDRVELVNVWDEKRWQHEEQEEVAKDEVGGEEAHLRDLA